MASTFTTLSILFSVALVLVISIDPSFSHHEKHNKHNNLKKICSKTSNLHWCLKLIKSDSRTWSVDNRGLVEITIELAYTKAIEIHRDFNSLYDSSGKYHFKDRYNSCSKNYHDTIRNLDQIKRLLKDGDYKRIEVQIADSLEEIRDCKNELEKSGSDSSDLKKRTKEFELLCDVVRISSKYLQREDKKYKEYREDRDDEEDRN